MSIESEIIVLVQTLPAFTAPIGVSSTDPVVMKQVGYMQVPQDVTRFNKPFIFWQGPFKTDLGQAAIGFSGQKKADFWFFLCHGTMTEAMQWGDDIQADLETYFNENAFMNLRSFRLTSAIFLDRRPLQDQQQSLTAKEFPVSRCMIGYTFGYQSSGN